MDRRKLITENKHLDMAKLQYYLKTWGSFFSHPDSFPFKEGEHYFNSKSDREDYLSHIQSMSDKMGTLLATSICDGFHCDVITTLHRVVEYEGRQYYNKYELGPDFNLYGAKYIMDYKWAPGHNHYPLGEDHDYEAHPVTIVAEWITGAFDNNFLEEYDCSNIDALISWIEDNKNRK